MDSHYIQESKQKILSIFRYIGQLTECGERHRVHSLIKSEQLQKKKRNLLCTMSYCWRLFPLTVEAQSYSVRKDSSLFIKLEYNISSSPLTLHERDMDKKDINTYQVIHTHMGQCQFTTYSKNLKCNKKLEFVCSVKAKLFIPDARFWVKPSS